MALLKGQVTPPYKVYTALLNQSGTADPVITELDNTTGATVTASRGGPGQYNLMFNYTVLTTNKTTVLIGAGDPGSDYGHNTARTYNTSNIAILTTLAGIIAGYDDRLSNTTIEVRVYP